MKQKCTVCTILFIGDKDTCSEKCEQYKLKYRYKSHETKKTDIEEKICKLCGKAFKPEHHATKYCSKECRAIVDRETALKSKITK